MHKHEHVHKPGHQQASMHTRELTHTEKFVIFIAFPREKLLQEGASMLRYTYTACLVQY